jgi:hypothetical protein
MPILLSSQMRSSEVHLAHMQDDKKRIQLAYRYASQVILACIRDWRLDMASELRIFNKLNILSQARLITKGDKSYAAMSSYLGLEKH